MGKVAFLGTTGNQTTLEGLTKAVAALIQGDGVLGSTDMQVTQNGPDNKVLIATGRALVGFNAPTAADETQFYYPFMDTTQTATISANSSGNPRIDAIVGYVDTTAVGANDNDGAWKTIAVAGTPAATPAAPTDANIVTALGAGVPYILLAHVAVANGFSTIVNANITDKRPIALSLTKLASFMQNFVVSGLVWSQTSGLVGGMTAGLALINGQLIYKPILSHTFTASRDTYIDAPYNAVPTTTDDLTYTAVTNGNAAPALAAGYIRLAKVVTNGSAITSVVTSGGSWDSLGNPIYPNDPFNKMLGRVTATTDQGTFSSETDITGLVMRIIVPTGGRWVTLTVQTAVASSVSDDGAQAFLIDTDSSTKLKNGRALCRVIVADMNFSHSAFLTAGTHNYKVSMRRTDGSGVLTSKADVNDPASLEACLK